jgi:hypothetical protein
MRDLRARLVAAGDGPLPMPKPNVGDVMALEEAPGSTAFCVFQILSGREIAVFDGTYPSDAAVLDQIATRQARRVPARVASLMRAARNLGKRPLRKDLKGRKLYASESGAIDGYCLMTASAGAYRDVGFDEARAHDRLYEHDADAVRSVAKGKQPFPRVRSPEEREAELSERSRDQWNARRLATTPGPFGDVEAVEDLLQWIEMTGIANVIEQCSSQAVGLSGYGRPNERSERQAYAFVGLVAHWRGWAGEAWPVTLLERKPPRPDEDQTILAVTTARTLAGRVMTRDAELRLIWENGPDGGAALRGMVASLQAALAVELNSAP